MSEGAYPRTYHSISEKLQITNCSVAFMYLVRKEHRENAFLCLDNRENNEKIGRKEKIKFNFVSHFPSSFLK